MNKKINVDERIVKIKNAINQYIECEHEYKKTFQCFMRETMNRNADYLNEIFKRHEKMTMKHFYLCEKIRRVKRMLFFENKTLMQISIELNYCSVQHLSMQFKKMTNINVNEFIENEIRERIEKEDVMKPFYLHNYE